MTVAVESPVRVYVLTGTTLGPFATNWKYESAAEVSVFLEANGVEVQLGTVSGYSLSGADPLNAGGDVTLMSGVMPIGGWGDGVTGTIYRLLLRRATALSQTVAFASLARFKPETNEQGFNRLTRQTQDVAARTARAIVSPEGETPLIVPRLASRKGMLTSFNAITGALEATRSLAAFDTDVSNTATKAAAAASSASAAAGSATTANSAKVAAQTARDQAQAILTNVTTVGGAAIGDITTARDDALASLAGRVGEAQAAAALAVAQNARFGSRAIVQAAAIPADVTRLNMLYRAPVIVQPATLAGGGDFRRESLPNLASHPASAIVRSADRFMPDGTAHATNGGYWVYDPAGGIDPDVLGGLRDGVTVCNSAWNDALALSRLTGKPVRPKAGGEHLLNGAAPLIIHHGQDIDAEDGAVISAGTGVTFIAPDDPSDTYAGMEVKTVIRNLRLKPKGAVDFGLKIVSTYQNANGALPGIVTGVLIDNVQFIAAEADIYGFRSSPDNYFKTAIYASNLASIDIKNSKLMGGFEAIRQGQFTAYISGNQLIVVTLTGGKIYQGHKIVAPGVTVGTLVGAQVSGTTGGAGVYNITHANLGSVGSPVTMCTHNLSADQMDCKAIHLAGKSVRISIDNATNIQSYMYGIYADEDVEGMQLTFNEMVYVGVGVYCKTVSRGGGTRIMGNHINCVYRGVYIEHRKVVQMNTINVWRNASYLLSPDDATLFPGWAAIEGVDLQDTTIDNIATQPSSLINVNYGVKLSNCQRTTVTNADIIFNTHGLALTGCTDTMIDTFRASNGSYGLTWDASCDGIEVGTCQFSAIAQKEYNGDANATRVFYRRRGARPEPNEITISADTTETVVMASEIRRRYTGTLPFAHNMILSATGAMPGDTMEFRLRFSLGFGVVNIIANDGNRERVITGGFGNRAYRVIAKFLTTAWRVVAVVPEAYSLSTLGGGASPQLNIVNSSEPTERIGQVATGCLIPSAMDAGNKMLMALVPFTALENLSMVSFGFPNWYVDSVTHMETALGSSAAAIAGAVEYPAGIVQQLWFTVGSCVASISGNQMVVTGVPTVPLAAGQKITGLNVLPGTTIVSGPGGGAGTYTISNSHASAVASQTLSVASTTGSIPALSEAYSDFVAVNIPKGAAAILRIWFSNPDGIPQTTGECLQLGEKFKKGVSVADNTMSGTITSTSAGSGQSYKPVAIIGNTTRPSVFLMGDSLVVGAIDVPNDKTGNFGTLARRLGQAYGYICVARAGDHARVAAAGYARRASLAKWCSFAVNAYGNNDLFIGANETNFTASVASNVMTVSAVTLGALANGQTLKYSAGGVVMTGTVGTQLTGTTGGPGTYNVTGVADLTARAFTASNPRTSAQLIADQNTLNALLPSDMPIYMTTVTPRVSHATSNYGDLAGQVTWPFGNSPRLSYNAAVRDGSQFGTNVRGFIDIADAFENERDGGKVAVHGASQALTGDGTHPNALGGTIIKRAPVWELLAYER